jgi:hypothetical protein
LRFEPAPGPDGQTWVRFSYGQVAQVLDPVEVQVAGVAALLAAQAADLENGVRAYFAKARDQALAQKILSTLMPYLEKHRKEVLAAWFKGEASKAQ